MALIKCPECGKEISDKSRICIHCGFPIKNNALVREVSLPKMYIYPGFLFICIVMTILAILGTIFSVYERAGLFALIFICPAVVFDCVYCIFLKREINYHKLIYANPDLYKEVMLASIIECPYCHSTDTTKISTASKAVHTAFFGIFSMSRNSKQWHCNKCDSDF